jgi:hypothetical protein
MSRRDSPPASTIDDLLHPSPDAGPSRRTAARQRLHIGLVGLDTAARPHADHAPSPPRLSRANSANGGGTRDQWHVTNGTGPLDLHRGDDGAGEGRGRRRRAVK